MINRSLVHTLVGLVGWWLVESVNHLNTTQIHMGHIFKLLDIRVLRKKEFNCYVNNNLFSASVIL